MNRTEVAADTYEKTKNTVKVMLLAVLALVLSQLVAMITRGRGE